MEAVGDLPGLWRALARSLGIKASTVPADNLYLRVPPEPLGGGGRRAIRQYVDYLSSLQVHNDRPVGTALSPAPVIDAGHPDGRAFATLRLVASGPDEVCLTIEPTPEPGPGSDLTDLLQAAVDEFAEELLWHATRAGLTPRG